MSRLYLRIGYVAAIAGIWFAAEQQSPGITLSALRGVPGFAVALLTAGWWAVVIIATVAGIGYLTCRIKHAPAIRDASVERIHERRIVQLRMREIARQSPGSN